MNRLCNICDSGSPIVEKAGIQNACSMQGVLQKILNHCIIDWL